MAVYRKNMWVSKFGPQFNTYHVETRKPVFFGLFNVWCSVKKISRSEYLSPIAAELFI